MIVNSLSHVKTVHVSPSASFRLFHSCGRKPLASEVLTAYLTQCNEPQWTSYFVRHKDVVNDQYGMSYFNWRVGKSNYNVYRIGCYPFIKYHCMKGPVEDVVVEDRFYRVIKAVNLGIPCLVYGITAVFLIKHRETVHTRHGDVQIHFLLEEDKNSLW